MSTLIAGTKQEIIALYELIQINENDYYVNSPAKIGIVRIGGEEVVLIDSGNDKDAAKKLLHIFEENQWKLRTIYNTHAHADHTGGNRYLQKQTGCRIYANGIEATYGNYPIMEPAGLYGGLPTKELRHKFLMAQPSCVEAITESNLPEGMELLPLPGHSMDMTGFLTKDGTAYIGDCISSVTTMEKYGIIYMWDPDTAMKTLEYVKTLKARYYLPSHVAMTENIEEIVEKNIAYIKRTFDTIFSLCAEPITFEELLKKLLDAYGMRASIQQYAMIGSTLRSYLTNLQERGKVAFELVDNRMLWKQEEK